MHSSLLFAAFLAAATPSFAQNGHYEPEQNWIPEVAEDVQHALTEFASYSAFKGLPKIDVDVKLPNLFSQAQAASPQCNYWLENITHQGIAAFNPNPSTYQVFRNVKDFGAKGDGVTDDTAAINSAISSGNRCAPGKCSSSTTTPALVYFPAGTYMISSSIIDYYYTQLIGNPNCVPTIRAFSTFNPGTGYVGLIDGDPYVGAGGALAYGSTNVFWRQIRNFVIDMTLIPAQAAVTGIHWPTGQATSIQNVVFNMNANKGTAHQGIYIESGSGGFMTDLVFNGGRYGGNFGNQQFTMRNMTFNGVVTAINQIWDWGWTYYGLSINNCSLGLNMSTVGANGLSVGSVTLFDSTVTNTPVFVRTGYVQGSSSPPTANSLILENISLQNVPIAVQGGNGKTALVGTPTNTKIAAWGEGHEYTPKGPTTFQSNISPNNRPSSLLGSNGNYYVQSKPQYGSYPVSSFISARSAGATGNGKTDDTAALQKAINSAVAQNKILFVDAGDYIVTSTLLFPPGLNIVGESYSVILSRGSFFNDMSNPQPIVQIGSPGQTGSIQWSDMIVSTQGQQQGAILFEYNLNSAGSSSSTWSKRAASSSSISGIWDVHARIGGFAGSNLQAANCPITPNTKVTASNLNQNCIAAFLTFHITAQSSGLYLENNWLWTADHDADSQAETQITVYSGRGLLDESAGPTWLVGGAVEHHTLYQYQFNNASNVFAGQIQTETPYYQPNPSAPTPWTYNATYADPKFPKATINANGYTIPNADAWGLRIVNSDNILIYGAGLYSFFNNYSTTCSAQGNGEICQSEIFQLVGSNSNINVYNENTVGTHYQITTGTTQTAYYNDNLDGFVDTIALYRSG